MDWPQGGWPLVLMSRVLSLGAPLDVAEAYVTVAEMAASPLDVMMLLMADDETLMAHVAMVLA